jgi:hypothetical protein
MVWEVSGFNGPYVGPLSTVYRRNAPLPTLAFPIIPVPVSNLEAEVLSSVGDSRKLDCNGNWVANRDSVDTRLISEYLAGTGIIPTTEANVGGFPIISGGPACTDTDNDGMPDVWEAANGLNPNNASDGNAVASNGYRNVENYMNGINIGSGSSSIAPPTDLSITVR